MRLGVLVTLALAAVGCDKRYQPGSFTCESDADCVVSCVIPDNCCGAGCQCDRPYHEDELAAIRAHNKKRCGEKFDCPYYSCPEPTTRVLPVCKNGRCAAVEVKDTCENDAECVLSCERPSSCCPDPCECDTAYTREMLEHINAANKAMCAGKKRDCPQADCAAPTDDLAARCFGNRCAVKRTPRRSSPAP